MIKLPKELALLERLSAALPCGIRQRFLILALGAIVAMGRRTVSRVLWAIGSLRQGHASSYHRFFSKSLWSMPALGRVLAALVFELLPKDKPIVLLVDDTVVKHRGDKVYGRAWHRNAVESTDKFLVQTLGHKWVVLAASVLLPGCKRPWALPLLAALYLAPPKRSASADGQSVRRAKTLNAAGGWYRCRGSSRGAIIPIRWVYVHELKHDGEAYFYSTDLTLGTQQITGYFACRWSIEVTFQEVRAHLGFATTRQRCRKSVLRTAPCLLGLFSVVSLIYAQIAQHKPLKLNNAWRGKHQPSFVDALTAVRQVIWTKTILPRLDHDGLVAKLSSNLRNLLLQRLIAAA